MNIHRWMMIVGLALSCLTVSAWEMVGPGGGGWIQSILASRHNPNRLYVGCDVGGVYRSDDGGRTYRVSTAGLQCYFIECMVEHPNNPDILYVGGKSGVYKSVDGGRTFQWLRTGFPPVQEHGYSAMVSKLAIDPQHPEILYAAIGQPRERRGGQGALYKSCDSGATWQQVIKDKQLGDLAIYDLAMHAQQPQRLLIATAKGVYASLDGGAHWALSSQGLPSHLRTRRLAQSPSQPEIVYVSLEGKSGETPWQAGVYRSDDGGATWQPRNAGLKQWNGKEGQSIMFATWVDTLAIHPQNPDIVYAGSPPWIDSTIYKTTDGGQHWTRSYRGGKEGNVTSPGWISFWGVSAECLTLSPLEPERLYFGTSGMVYATTNGAATWEQRYTQERADGKLAGTGLEVTCLHSVTPHPNIQDRLYFGYYDIGLLISEDGGKSFERCMQGVPKGRDNSCFCVAFDPDDNQRVYAGFGEWGSNHGLVMTSADGGRNWVSLEKPGNGMVNARPRDLFVSRDTLAYLAVGTGICVSTNRGETWQVRNGTLPGERLCAFAVDAAAQRYAVALKPAQGEAGAIYTSLDRGLTWQPLNPDQVPLSEVRQLRLCDGWLYCTLRGCMIGSNYVAGGAYRCELARGTWTRIYTNRFCEALTVDAHNHARLYISLHDHPYHDQCRGGGVMVSNDRGTTWQRATDATLHNSAVTWIAQDPFRPARLWLGTGGNSAFYGDVP